VVTARLPKPGWEMEHGRGGTARLVAADPVVAYVPPGQTRWFPDGIRSSRRPAARAPCEVPRAVFSAHTQLRRTFGGN
jgi:hypothetical protein